MIGFYDIPSRDQKGSKNGGGGLSRDRAYPYRISMLCSLNLEVPICDFKLDFEVANLNLKAFMGKGALVQDPPVYADMESLYSFSVPSENHS